MTTVSVASGIRLLHSAKACMMEEVATLHDLIISQGPTICSIRLDIAIACSRRLESPKVTLDDAPPRIGRICRRPSLI